MPIYRLAITGASSTGKTTLANALITNPEFRSRIPTLIEEGARPLAQRLGYVSMDSLTEASRRDFQRQLFLWKAQAESIEGSYLADRSFVDLAAVWLERDTATESAEVKNELLLPCRQLSQRYTMHIHVPGGIFAFADDGFRERVNALHERIARRILDLLVEWQLPFFTLLGSTLDARVAEVNAYLDSLGTEFYTK